MNCEYQGECPYTNNCAEDCFVKELLSDFHNLEKRYFELNKENERLKKNHQCYNCKHYVEVDNGGENTIIRECAYEQEYFNKCYFFESEAE